MGISGAAEAGGVRGRISAHDLGGEALKWRKKVVVTDKVKIQGIRRRWLINSVGVVLLVLALALGTFSTAMWSYYYSSTMNDLKRRAADDAGALPPLPAVNTGPTPRTRYRSLRTRQSWNSSFWMIPGQCSTPATIWPPAPRRGPRTSERAELSGGRGLEGDRPHTGRSGWWPPPLPSSTTGRRWRVVRYVTSLVAIDWQFFLAMGLACLLGRPSWPWSTSPISTLSAPSWSLWPVLQRPPGSSLMEAGGADREKI